MARTRRSQASPPNQQVRRGCRRRCRRRRFFNRRRQRAGLRFRPTRGRFPARRCHRHHRSPPRRRRRHRCHRTFAEPRGSKRIDVATPSPILLPRRPTQHAHGCNQLPQRPPPAITNIRSRVKMAETIPRNLPGRRSPQASASTPHARTARTCARALLGKIPPQHHHHRRRKHFFTR